MLGRFLEFSIAAPDVRASLEFYTTLGFSQAGVGEAWSHPYAVVTDGRICLGLHQDASSASFPSLTFVKPDLLKYADALERQAVEFEFRRLGNDVFNEVGWLDPSGHLIRLLEARTFSPSKRKPNESSLGGYFLEIALPSPDFDAAKAYWERWGFVGMDETNSMLPHVSCTSDTIGIGLYDPAHVREPTLLFEVDDFDGVLAKLRAVGLAPNGRIPGPLRASRAAMLIAPEGTPLLVVATG